jgi:hypothetical protein
MTGKGLVRSEADLTPSMPRCQPGASAVSTSATQ